MSFFDAMESLRCSIGLAATDLSTCSTTLAALLLSWLICLCICSTLPSSCLTLSCSRRSVTPAVPGKQYSIVYLVYSGVVYEQIVQYPSCAPRHPARPSGKYKISTQDFTEGSHTRPHLFGCSLALLSPHLLQLFAQARNCLLHGSHTVLQAQQSLKHFC